jgi:hypothetical protein
MNRRKFLGSSILTGSGLVVASDLHAEISDRDLPKIIRDLRPNAEGVVPITVDEP